MPQRVEHTHRHSHTVMHPHAFGFHLRVEHEHPHSHTSRREANLTDTPHHVMHRHSRAEYAEMRRQTQ